MARVWSEGPIPDWYRRRARHVCDTHGVTVEHLVATIRARRIYRAESKRRAARAAGNRRTNGAKVSKRILFIADPQKHVALGEGELHSLLKTCGMTEQEFCALVGIEPRVLRLWYGHPLHAWPLVVLRQHAEIAAMRAELGRRGVTDFEQFKPKMLPPMPGPNYPRKVSELKIITNAEDQRDWSPWKKR